MYILGISAFYHDSAACIIKNGEILAAAQEERFTRIKHDHSFPKNAIKYCLKEAGISSLELNYVSFYDKPFLKFERILETYLFFAPRGIRSFLKAIPLWIKKKLWIKDIISKEINYNGKIIFPEHHESHAASAFYPSPFQESAFLTMDGVGEWATTSFGIAKDNHLNILADINFPHSLGLLYSAFTYYIGFKVNSGEYKLMGLAPYGKPLYKTKIIKNLIDLKDDGSFRLDMKYFNYCHGLTMTNNNFNKLFGQPSRKPESKIQQFHMDIARSIQEVIEEIVIKIARYIQQETKQKNLCLAGGVALNCVANGKLLEEKIFENIWIQPASGDAGGALGAAMIVWYQYLNNSRIIESNQDSMNGSLLGPEYNNEDIELFLKSIDCIYERYSIDEIINKTTDFIANEKVIGWFQGRMEYGPRALGARSIIGDARSPRMQKIMNLKIKYRESFRPFAPSIISEKISDYFILNTKSPYMLLVAQVKKDKLNKIPNEKKKHQGIDLLNIIRSVVPAVTHVDNSARVQSVHKETNAIFHKLISLFNDKYDCPLIINTSFNVRGEPIVCTPEDAYRCFLKTEMDYLVIGNFIIDKNKQKLNKYEFITQNKFELD